MRVGLVAALGAAVMLCVVSCAPQVKQIFIRSDGQSVHTNPALMQQGEIDRAICQGEAQKANMSGTNFCRGLADCAVAGAVRNEQMQQVGAGCMASRGYILVPEDQAEAKSVELRALEASKNAAAAKSATASKPMPSRR